MSKKQAPIPPNGTRMSEEEIRALIWCACNLGRHWKRELRHAWETGRYPYGADSGTLQFIRNKIGPSGLSKIKIDVVDITARLADGRKLVLP